MASVPLIRFGPLPPEAQPFGLVFDWSAAGGNQLAGLQSDVLSLFPPGAFAITAITGRSSQAGGFALQVLVTHNNEQRQLAGVAGLGRNLSGTAQRPFRFDEPQIADAGDMVTVEVSNLDPAAADIQIVLWGCCSHEQHAQRAL